MSEAAVRESGEYPAFALVDGRLPIADFNRFSKLSRHLRFAGANQFSLENRLLSDYNFRVLLQMFTPWCAFHPIPGLSVMFFHSFTKLSMRFSNVLLTTELTC